VKAQRAGAILWTDLISNQQSPDHLPVAGPIDRSRLPRMWHSPEVRFVLLVATVAGLLQWLATSPGMLVHINWDAGSYLHQIAAGTLVWSTPTWTAHAGLQYLYLAACALVRPLHGTPADGFRLLAALSFAVSTGALAYAAVKSTGSRVLAVLVVLFWATAFVTQFLTFTLEDNIVFITPTILLCALLATTRERWQLRHSLLAGLLSAAALLLSIQGVLYVFPPVLFIAFLPSRRRAMLWRGQNLAVVLGGFALGLLLFVGFQVMVCALPWRDTLAHLAQRPTSTFPQTGAGLVAQVLDVEASMRMIGVATALHLLRDRQPFSSQSSVVEIGTAVTLLQLALVIATGLWARRRRRPLPFFFALTLLGLTALTSLYRDVEYAYLKRTDFVPVALAFLALTSVAAAKPGGVMRKVLAGALTLGVVLQTVGGLTWRHHEVASYQTLDTTVLGRRLPGYHGVPGEGSFLRHFRRLAAGNPKACAFVFDLSDVAQGRWNPDLTGTMLSELRSPYVVTSPALMNTWPRRLPVVDTDTIRRSLSSCAWFSQAARKHLGLPPSR
jgi:hypothetical protein